MTPILQLRLRPHCQLPEIYILDATHTEEQAIPLKLILLYSFSKEKDFVPSFMGMRLMGPGQISLNYIKVLAKVSHCPFDRSGLFSFCYTISPFDFFISFRHQPGANVHQEGENYAKQLVLSLDSQLNAQTN